MRKVKKSDPFTGLELDCLEMNNKDLVIDLPFLGTQTLNYNNERDCYEIPKTLLKFYEVVSATTASELLDVSRMRIHRMCKDGVLKYAKVNNGKLISLKSINDFMNRNED